MLGLSALWLHANTLVLLSFVCDMANFEHELLLTDRKVSKIYFLLINKKTPNRQKKKINKINYNNFNRN